MALVIVAAAALYEESWTFDGDERVIHHRYGFVFFAKKIDLPFDKVGGFRLRAFIRGMIPGGKTEREETARILGSLDPTNDANALSEQRTKVKKAFVSLLCDDTEGGGLVINTPARPPRARSQDHRRSNRRGRRPTLRGSRLISPIP